MAKLNLILSLHLNLILLHHFLLLDILLDLKPSAYLQNYHYHNASSDPCSPSTVVPSTSSTHFPLSQVLSYSLLSPLQILCLKCFFHP